MVEDAKPSEVLRYAVNWPSGLSLGEASISKTRVMRSGQESFEYSFQVEAAIPAFTIRESAHSAASSGLCALELEREGVRGPRKIAEKTVFDPEHRTASRTTNGGGKTEMNTSGCAKDALTFLDFVRRELAAGRLPAQQTVYYGSGYQVRVEYLGSERVMVEGAPAETDRLRISVKGPASQHNAEVLFTKDSDRTPVQIRLPLAMGRFTLELMR